MNYVIKEKGRPEVFVAGFNEEHLIVQSTTNLRYAKKFSSVEDAEYWVELHASAGYGFSGDVEILPHEESNDLLERLTRSLA